MQRPKGYILSKVTEMRRLTTIIFYLLALLPPSLKASNVLIFGDSVDRHVVQEWCVGVNHTKGFISTLVDWGSAEIKYGTPQLHSPGYCRNYYNDSVAQVHVFGSLADGPYYTDKWEVASGPLEVRTTSYRINNAISQYYETFGALPDKIYFKSVSWDSAYTERNGGRYKADYFRMNVLARLAEIEEVVKNLTTTRGLHGNKVVIGLHTAPQVYYINPRVEEYNNELRNLSQQANITLFDYDLDVWSSYDFVHNEAGQTYIFRHIIDIHPNHHYTYSAGQKLLDKEFSKFHYHNGNRPNTNLSESTFLRYTFYSDLMVTVDPSSSTSSHSGVLYYIHRDEASDQLKKWKFHHQELYFYHRGDTAFATLSALILDKVVVGGTLPHISTSPAYGYISKSGQMMMKHANSNLTSSVSNVSYFSLFGISGENMYTDVEDFWFRAIDPDAVIPDIYYREKLLLRQHVEKQVYLKEGMTLRPINSVEIFYKYGFDFEDVIGVMHQEYFSVFTYGTPLR